LGELLFATSCTACIRFEDVSERHKSSADTFDAAREEARDATALFNEVKQKRHDLFMGCFTHVSESLQAIYRDLTKSSKHPLGGNAYLSLDDSEEPYLGGIKYNAMPPMKRFRDMDQLSGGEKTVASLALLFAIHSFRPAPFFVMDEVDAALDNVNVKKVFYTKTKKGALVVLFYVLVHTHVVSFFFFLGGGGYVFFFFSQLGERIKI